MNNEIKFCNVAGVGGCLVGSDDRIICKVSEVPAMQQQVSDLEHKVAWFEKFACKTCGGAGSVGTPPDDYYDCPECVERSNKHDAEVVMRFANMVRGAYLGNFIDGALTAYDVYQSARNHVKDNYKVGTEAWTGDDAEKAKGLVDELQEMISQRGIDNTMLRVKEKQQQEQIDLYKSAFEAANAKLSDIGQTLYGEGLGVTRWHKNGDLQEFDTLFDDNDWFEVDLDECKQLIAATNPDKE